MRFWHRSCDDIQRHPQWHQRRASAGRQESLSMERHDMTMRAARYLLGAGIIAVAMVATAQPAAAQDTCFETSEGSMTYPALCGYVFTDQTQPADHEYDAGEGVSNVQVFVTLQDGTPVNNTGYLDCDPIAGCGYFNFIDWPKAGTYLFCIVDDQHTETNCKLRDDAIMVTVVLSPTGYYTELELVPPTPPPPPPTGPGTGTPGYWKNHPEAWPVQGVTIGGVLYKNGTANEISAAIKWMGKVGGDKTITIFSSLISAKLNVAVGNDGSCVGLPEAMASADLWLTAGLPAPNGHPVGSGVKASSAAWTLAEPWHTLMDDYNNGKLCAPHRD
jgi:hypothetical protein